MLAAPIYGSYVQTLKIKAVHVQIFTGLELVNALYEYSGLALYIS